MRRYAGIFHAVNTEAPESGFFLACFGMRDGQECIRIEKAGGGGRRFADGRGI